MVVTILAIGVTVWTQRVQSQGLLSVTMKAHREAYANRPWRGAGLAIRASGNIFVEDNARSALRRWAFSGLPRVVVLSGDFGSGELLSRLNLLHLYRVNRFAVSMMLKHDCKEIGDEEQSEDGPTWVNRRDFRIFLEETGWRRSGYGLWPKMMDPLAGSVTTAEMSVLRAGPNITIKVEEEAEFLAGVSWYDAFQYCRWRGGRLPSAEEAARFPVSSDKNVAEWSTTWHTESNSWIRAIMHGDNPSKLAEHIGVNPDLRLDRLGFRIFRFGKHGSS